MSSVLDLIQPFFPRAAVTPSGWRSFNAVCCHHRGQRADTRKRGGIYMSTGFTYNCFNCGFSSTWLPGRPISNKMRSLLNWMGVPDDVIKKVILQALKTPASEAPITLQYDAPRFEHKDLPELSNTIYNWVNNSDISAKQELQLSEVIAYMMKRGLDPLSDYYYWSPKSGMASRFIIPFKYAGDTVGWTSRSTGQSRPKYISDQPQHFIFNLDTVTDQQRYLFVVEGPLDAIAINGVALLHNDISDTQHRMIESLHKEVIVIPDRDSSGIHLINRALEFNWAVAFPTWEDNIKDASDAVHEYGQLFVTVDAIKTAVSGTIKINLLKRQYLENK